MLLALGAALVFAAICSAVLITAAWPWLKAYALARPNARSSHRTPTPQGGGIAVILAVLGTSWAVVALWPDLVQGRTAPFIILTAATLLLAAVGAVDDLRSLPAAPRLLLQCIAVGGVIAALPADLQVLPGLPWWADRTLLLIAGVWFVNLVNFMDGIDWMTVAEAVPVTGALVLLGATGAFPPLPAVLAAALLGALIGFAPFNSPVARLFLGDVGSLPIGLLLGWLLLALAAEHLAAALLLPLYYLADATVTLVRRAAAGEPVWKAHRTHFYQRATDKGFTVPEVVARVFAINLVLAGLAVATVVASGALIKIAALVAGLAVVISLLLVFARGPR